MIAHDEIVIPVSREVRHRPRPRALRGKEDTMRRICQGSRINIRRRAFPMVLTVAEHQVQVAVLIQIELKDPLQYPGV